MKDYIRAVTPVMLTLLGLTVGVACVPKSRNLATPKIAVPKGWVLTVNGAFVSHLKAKELKPAYSIDLQRKGENKEDRYYIKLAESLYPDPKIIRSNQKDKNKTWYFEKRWWVDEFKGYRIPYSITGDTVNYYINKYKKFKENLKKQQKLDPLKKEYKDRVNFFYKAEVIREKNPNKLENTPQVIVRLSMKWYIFCGQPCGWGFEKLKEVTFVGKDRILKVKGDGTTPLWKSSAETPYAPQQWITY